MAGASTAIEELLGLEELSELDEELETYTLTFMLMLEEREKAAETIAAVRTPKELREVLAITEQEMHVNPRAEGFRRNRDL